MDEYHKKHQAFKESLNELKKQYQLYENEELSQKQLALYLKTNSSTLSRLSILDTVCKPLSLESLKKLIRKLKQITKNYILFRAGFYEPWLQFENLSFSQIESELESEIELQQFDEEKTFYLDLLLMADLKEKLAAFSKLAFQTSLQFTEIKSNRWSLFKSFYLIRTGLLSFSDLQEIHLELAHQLIEANLIEQYKNPIEKEKIWLASLYHYKALFLQKRSTSPFNKTNEIKWTLKEATELFTKSFDTKFQLESFWSALFITNTFLEKEKTVFAKNWLHILLTYFKNQDYPQPLWENLRKALQKESLNAIQKEIEEVTDWKDLWQEQPEQSFFIPIRHILFLEVKEMKDLKNFKGTLFS